MTKLKSVVGCMFAFLLALANLGCVGVGAKEEVGYYCDTEYFETGGTTTTTTEIVTYDSYTMSDVHLDLLCPIYSNPTQSNSCAPMAATIAIVYHDITKADLIPDFEAGFYYNGVYIYKAQNTSTVRLKEHLYDLMGTNSIHPGTSLSQFMNGMTTYVNGQGYNINYNSCGNSFNINTAVSYIQQQLPIVMFLNSYKYIAEGGIYRTDGQTEFLCYNSTNGHVLVAYGYREFDYYKDGAVFKTDKFMVVAFGDGTTGYLPVNEVSKIDAAYAIDIY